MVLDKGRHLTPNAKGDTWLKAFMKGTYLPTSNPVYSHFACSVFKSAKSYW